LPTPTSSHKVQCSSTFLGTFYDLRTLHNTPITMTKQGIKYQCPTNWLAISSKCSHETILQIAK